MPVNHHPISMCISSYKSWVAHHRTCQRCACLNLCHVSSCRFQDVVNYFGLQPKPGEKEVTPNYIFMLWYEFCNDFKNSWIRQSKTISKERLKEAQENIKKITAEKRVETKKINANSLKERLRQKEANVSSS
ncbi:hypothetical protein CRENBAI_024484 [Crenichthys baileyi]|uniref:Uncharacterized protein n=1 Tax=Crenichthys baileyi TaxID=28760 RepID=A0AAV9RST4_9TELE